MQTLLAALLALTLAACASAASTDPPAAPAATEPSAHTMTLLTRYHWQLDDAVDAAGAHIGALLVRPDRPITLDFDARGVSVQNACNAMHAEYALDGDTLIVSHFLSTTMACADPAVNALDSAIRNVLQGTLTLALDAGGARPRLTLTRASGQRLSFSGVPTAATRYGSPGQVMFLEVAPQTVPCAQGAPGAQCLDVREVHYDARGLREGEPGPWHPLDQPIEGYAHQPGTRNVLRVRRYAIAHPERHGTDVAYVLDMVVESARAPHE